MNRREYENFTKECIMGSISACSSGCPINLDIPLFIEHVKKGNYKAAYQVYRNKAVFPGIVCQICDASCENKCVRRTCDDSINLKAIEKACVKFTPSKSPLRFNLPEKEKKVAIIGAGLAGLSCAVKLGMRNYQVDIYEKTRHVGGRLSSLLPSKAYQDEIASQLQVVKHRIYYESEVVSLEDMAADAILIATGKGGNDFGLLHDVDPKAFGSSHKGIFLAGGVLGAKPVEDIAQGVVAAFSIEKYLKTGSMDGMPDTFIQTGSCFHQLSPGVERKESIHEPSEGYTKDDAQREAGRCLQCDCKECRNACELFTYFNKTPKQMVGEAITSLHSKTSITKQQATRFVSSCNLCGLCGKVCPKEIDIGRMSYDFRHFKKEDKNYPAAFHEFYIRDMNHAMKDGALFRLPPGHKKASKLFFPGCQLGASDPRYVTESYRYLLSKFPDMGIMLGCCGAPADWAAEDEMNRQVLEEIRSNWQQAGRPVFVFACPTCMKQFDKFLPEIQGVTLYEIMAEHGQSKGKSENGPDLSCVHIFDPCSARSYTKAHESIRTLISRQGITIDELEYSREKARCCGHGGHILKANPEYAQMIVNNRISQGNQHYVTYCSNCKDVFCAEGKECSHILDIIFGLNNISKEPPSLSMRRKNRMSLKEKIKQEFFHEESLKYQNKEESIEIHISQELLKKMNRLLIMEEDIVKTIEHCQKTGRRIYDTEKNSYSGYLKQKYITYWVEYKEVENGYSVLNAYSHRVEILED